MKCCNSVCYNTQQSSRLIIVVVQLGAVKIYVASSGGAHEKRKTGWKLSLPPKLMVFCVSSPVEWMLVHFFAGVCFWISPCVWPNSGFWCCIFLPFYTDNSWIAHMKTLSFCPACSLKSAGRKGRQADKMHTLGASCSSVSSKLTGSYADAPTESIGNTPLCMPPAVPQALTILPQIITHRSNHGHLHRLAPDSPCSCFNWLNFISILCTLDWTWAQVRGGVSGNASSILNKISCHCSGVSSCSCYWQETSPQTNPSTML